MERKFPQLKAQRLESARRAKLEYDHFHAWTHRDSLRELAMRLTEAPQTPSAIEKILFQDPHAQEPLEGAGLPSFGLGQLDPQVPNGGEEAAVSQDVIHPPVVIDMTEAEGEEP
ncbi:hypothetical protein PI125_g4321 [Phytophthora idaei]|nr:hypothetical protein PI125_g4321 [Phytophthora idaei]